MGSPPAQVGGFPRGPLGNNLQGSRLQISGTIFRGRTVPVYTIFFTPSAGIMNAGFTCHAGRLVELCNFASLTPKADPKGFPSANKQRPWMLCSFVELDPLMGFPFPFFRLYCGQTY